MDNTERDNEFLLGAIGLFEDDDMGRETHIGDLWLTRNGEDLWDVYHQERTGADTISVYMDAIRPRSFPSAQVLATYLIELQESDPGSVDLPDDSSRFVGPSRFKQ